MRIRFIRPLLLAIAMLFLSSAAFAQIGVSVTIAPPELPVYEQPVYPGDGYIWTPGYWAWGEEAVISGCPVLGWTRRKWVTVDAGLLGLGRRLLFFTTAMGPDGRFLWRDQLRLRIFRPWI